MTAAAWFFAGVYALTMVAVLRFVRESATRTALLEQERNHILDLLPTHQRPIVVGLFVHIRREMAKAHPSEAAAIMKDAPT